MVLWLPAAMAVQPVDHDQNLAQPKLSRPFLAPELELQADLEPVLRLAPGQDVSMKTGAAEFLQREGGRWEVRWDRRTNRPNLIQGSGIALLPGKGNNLTHVELGLAADEAVELSTVEARLRAFIAENEDLLQTQAIEFQLDPHSSTAYGEGNTHWFIEFAQYANGVRVDRAQLFFRISHGNIVQFGEDLVAPVAINTRPSMDRADAFRAAWDELGFPAGTTLRETQEAGELLVLPVLPPGELAGEAYRGIDGAGYEHRLAWRFVFRVNDDDTTYQVLFDAHRGSIIEVRNLTLNVDAQVTAGVYPRTNTDTEIVVPMPFLAVSNGGAKVTDALGMYDYSGGTASSSLDGKYFRMSDACGSISLSNSTNGNLDFGTSGGTDCTTPGVGGSGNTHASRTGFYHLTNINRKAAGFLPGNSWLASKVTANMNINNQCNASYGSGQLNFYRSGGGCSNTGEIAAVFLHEWGHGMDDHSGGTANEYGSGEAVGDTFAFLETKDSCIGPNFRPGGPCHNCGTCTGVRDVEVFSSLGPATIARPSTITDAGGAACGRFTCPYLQQGFFPYQGPMGYQGHCESHIASSANWELTQALVDKYGEEEGWREMDRIWYGSLFPSKSAYRVVSGGKCNINAVVDGCAASNWYTAFLAADDDDGNLDNGTPNQCLIWDAFDAHGIACGERPKCSTSSSHTVGGTVSGLSGSGLVLALNGSSSLPIVSDGVFTFPDALPSGTAYAISVQTQPSNPEQTCTVANGSGTIGSNDVTDVAVTCSLVPPPVYTVGGTVSGLSGSGLVLALNGSTSLPVSADGVFTFPDGLPGGAAYAVSVQVQPSNPGQVCSVANGSGTIGAADVTDVAVTCTTPMYTVGGSVSGLSGSGLVLALNGSTSLPVSANGAFTFPGGFPGGSAYTVSVQAQPADPVQVCTVANASGTIGTTDVTNVAVTCAMPTYTVGGTVSGLEGAGLKLKLNDGANLLIPGNGPFAFARPMADGDTYVVSVTAQPADPEQVCTIANGSGIIDAADVGDVTVTCTAPPPPTHTVGGNVSGLAGNGLVLSLNGSTDLPIVGNGAFTFPGGLTSGSAYQVAVTTQPSDPAQTCEAANAQGTIGNVDVTDIEVTCTYDVTDRIFADGFELEARRDR